MRKYLIFPIIIPIIFVMMLFMLSTNVSANTNIDSSHSKMDYKVVCADNEQEACDMLEDMGYTPIDVNVAESDKRVTDEVVMVGYKEVSESERDRELTEVGSVFGKSQIIMICGAGVIVGIIIGMVSMKFKRFDKEIEDEE